MSSWRGEVVLGLRHENSKKEMLNPCVERLPSYTPFSRSLGPALKNSIGLKDAQAS
jgi:hypothetical protein